MKGPETLGEKFIRYKGLGDEGISVEDVCKKMSREYLDHGSMIGMLKQIFGLSEQEIH